MPHAQRPTLRTFALALIATLAVFAFGRAAAAAPAGSVVGLSGSCVVVSGGQRAPLKIGQPVQVSDTVEVPADGKLKLRMTDGSVVSVAAGSSVTVASYSVNGSGQRADGKLSLAQGLIRAVVAPGAPATFEVDTAVGAAAARGTDLFVEASPGSMQVGVLTGTVSMTSTRTGRSVTIPARWGARLEGGRDPVPARVWSPQEFDAVIARTSVP